MAGNLKIPPGLLRFCLQHSDDPTGTTSGIPQRDPKDYEWLKEALGGLESDIDLMKKVIAKLTSPDTSLEQRRILLEELQYLVEDLDNANELHKMGGLKPILEFLSTSDDEQTRMWSAWILTSLVQNNPAGVLTALENSAFDIVLTVLAKETHPETRVRLMSAVSGFLSSENPSVTKYFLERDGLGLLSTALDRTPKERLRAMVTLRTLLRISSSPQQLQDAILQHNIISKVVAILKETNDELTPTEREDLRLKAVGLLSSAVEGHPAIWRELAEANLKEWIQAHLSQLLRDNQQRTQKGEEPEPIDSAWYSLLKQLKTEPTSIPDSTPTPTPTASSQTTPTTNGSQPLLLL